MSREKAIFKVGGCVRDEVMGRIPHDIDFVVVGETVESMIEQGFKQVGADFPVFLDENGDEFALARTERKTGKGYNGFSTGHSVDVTLEEDCARRDLTINSMAMGDDKKIIDFFNGQKDIQEKRLRHVSGAFADDPVRVLRIARFNARFGSEWAVAIETKILVAEMIDSDTLDELTPERIWKELKQVLEADNSDVFFDCLFDLGALHIVFPELRDIDVDSFHELNRCNTLNEKLATLHNHCGRDNVSQMLERLKAPTSARDFIELQDKLLAILMPTFDEIEALPQMALAIVGNNRLSKQQLRESLNHIRNMPLKFCDLNHFANTMRMAFFKCKNVNFDSLSDDERLVLKGSQIGERLSEIKLNKMASLFNT